LEFLQDEAIIVVNKPHGMPVQVGNFMLAYLFPEVS
jgi:23S rRNA-/tRNA-specific pseudouridylate synthase